MDFWNKQQVRLHLRREKQLTFHNKNHERWLTWNVTSVSPWILPGLLSISLLPSVCYISLLYLSAMRHKNLRKRCRSNLYIPSNVFCCYTDHGWSTLVWASLSCCSHNSQFPFRPNQSTSALNIFAYSTSTDERSSEFQTVIIHWGKNYLLIFMLNGWPLILKLCPRDLDSRTKRNMLTATVLSSPSRIICFNNIRVTHKKLTVWIL